MECGRHKGENFLFLCVKCDNAFVCKQCMLESHNGHPVASFENEAETIKNKLKNKASENAQLVSDLDIQLQSLANAESKQKEASDNTNAQIRKTGEDYHQFIDNYTDGLLSECAEKLQKNLRILEDQSIAISSQKKKAVEFGTQMKHILNITSAVEAIKEYKKLECVKIEKQECKIPKTIHYKEYSINQNPIGDYFGTVVTSSFDDEDSDSTDHVEPEIGNSLACGSDFVEQKKLKVVSEFQHSWSNAVSVLTPYDRNHCLVKCKQETVIKLTDENGNVIRHFDPKSDKVRGIDKMSDGSAYICCVNPNSIIKINFLQETESKLFSTGEMSPLDIRCSNKGDIFVVLEKLPFFSTITGSSKRVIVKYNDRGEEQAVVERDRYNDLLFKDPVTLRINHAENTIAVINEDSDHLRYLVLMDWSFDVRLRYLGHGHTVSGDQKFILPTLKAMFNVYDLAFDNNDNMLICEEYSRSVQLLSPKCEILTNLFTDDVYAWSLAITDSGNIWLGRKDGRIKVMGYI